MPIIYGKVYWASMCRKKELEEISFRSSVAAINLPISELPLSIRSYNGLIRANLRTIKDVANVIKIEDWNKQTRQIGAKSKNEIECVVRSFLDNLR